MWKGWLQVWIPDCGQPQFHLHKCPFCCCNLMCLWMLGLLFKPLLHPTCSSSEWMLHTVHLSSSKVSKVLFFSICLRWLELAGRSSRDPCQILMSSVLAFDPLSPLFPGWLLSNSITFSLRQQEIVCSYSWYPSVKANVQSSAQVPVPSEKSSCCSCLSRCLLSLPLTVNCVTCAWCFVSSATDIWCTASVVLQRTSFQKLRAIIFHEVFMK